MAKTDRFFTWMTIESCTARIFEVMCGGEMIQPIRQPVAEAVFETDCTTTVRSRIPGNVAQQICT
jgi:hypothetical protein